MATEAPVAPAAPPAGPTPPNPVAPTTTINVVPQPIQKSEPPKKGSMMEQMRTELRKKAKVGGEPAPQEPITPSEPTTPPDPGTEPPEPTAEIPTDPAVTPETKKEKANPWKIVDTWKKRAAEAEAKLAEAAANAVNPAEKVKLEEKLTALEAQNKELAEEIKYEAYVKSPEFKQNYEKPYELAWQAAMGELSEITVIDNGAEREVVADDILQLVNLKLGPARELAEEKFGHFADDVMRHRKQIKDLFLSKQAALESARKDVDTKQRQFAEQNARQINELQSHVQQAWTKANDLALSDPKAGKFFKPVEGDDENNKRLERGYRMVDEAWSHNALDPALTQQQREQIVTAQAAVRHRAAAFGRVIADNQKLAAELAELKSRLESYEGSTPTTGGSLPASQPGIMGGSVMEQMKSRLRGLAK